MLSFSTLRGMRTTAPYVSGLCDGDYADTINPKFLDLRKQHPDANEPRLFALCVYLRVREVRAYYRACGLVR